MKTRMWFTATVLSLGLIAHSEDAVPAMVGPVTVSTSGSQLTVKIEKSVSKILYETTRKVHPHRLICEFPTAKLKGDPNVIPVGQAGLARIIVESNKSKKAVITMEFSQKVDDWSAEETATSLMFQIVSATPLKPIETAAKPAPKPVASATPTGKPAPKPEVKPTVKAETPKPAPVKPTVTEVPPTPVAVKTEKPQETPEDDSEIKIVKVTEMKKADPDKKEDQENGMEDPEQNAPVKDATTVKPMKKGDLDQKVDLHLQNADLLATLINIVDELGYNLVPSKSVTGSVTIRLTQVPIRKALEHILNQAGLTFIVEDNVIRVATSAEFLTEADQGILQTRYFPLNYATAAGMADSVRAVISSRGKIQIDTRTNGLIVTDTVMKIKEVEDMINKLDSVTRQVEIEAAVIAFRRGKSKEVGIQWGVAQGSITGRTPTGAAAVDTNVVIAPPTSTGSGFGTVSIGTIISGTTIGALLIALERNDDAELLARPRITTLDNKKATINITTDFPYTSAFNQQTGVATFSTVSTGIIMEVTPQITSNGWVTLKVKPTVSSVISAGPPPVVDKREVETEVLIKNGSTFAIGGLLREDETVTTTKVPLLGDVPVIGSVFKSTSLLKTKNELTVLITPKIITGE